jgi:hypothetical protein
MGMKSIVASVLEEFMVDVRNDVLSVTLMVKGACASM